MYVRMSVLAEACQSSRAVRQGREHPLPPPVRIFVPCGKYTAPTSSPPAIYASGLSSPPFVIFVPPTYTSMTALSAQSLLPLVKERSARQPKQLKSTY